MSKVSLSDDARTTFECFCTLDRASRSSTHHTVSLKAPLQAPCLLYRMEQYSIGATRQEPEREMLLVGIPDRKSVKRLLSVP